MKTLTLHETTFVYGASASHGEGSMLTQAACMYTGIASVGFFSAVLSGNPIYDSAVFSFLFIPAISFIGAFIGMAGYLGYNEYTKRIPPEQDLAV